MSIGGGFKLVVAEDPYYTALARGGHELVTFTRDGRFVRRIGRQGEGPGEFIAVVGAEVRGSAVYVHDIMRGLIVVFSVDGSYLRQHRFPDFDGDFLIQDSLVAISASRNFLPDLVGYPLHRVDLESGGVVTSFGARSEQYVPSQFEGMVARRAFQDDGRVWLATLGEFRFEKWNSSSRELEEEIRGTLPWFPEAPRVYNGAGPPPTFLTSFVVDHADRLWVLTSVADERWRSVVSPDPSRPGRARIIDPVQAWDARLDVFDLRNRTHVSRIVWDDSASGELTLSPSGEAVLYRHVVDEGSFTERIIVLHLGLEMQ